jgi:hypothetical protein
MRHLRNLVAEPGEAIGYYADRALCRILGLHGRGCRGRTDHIAPWQRANGGGWTWTGRGRWRS